MEQVLTVEPRNGLGRADFTAGDPSRGTLEVMASPSQSPS